MNGISASVLVSNFDTDVHGISVTLLRLQAAKPINDVAMIEIGLVDEDGFQHTEFQVPLELIKRALEVLS